MEDKSVMYYVIGCLLLMGAMLYGARTFNMTATPIKVYQVEVGVKCASMITADGVAIDCWKEGNKNGD